MWGTKGAFPQQILVHEVQAAFRNILSRDKGPKSSIRDQAPDFVVRKAIWSRKVCECWPSHRARSGLSRKQTRRGKETGGFHRKGGKGRNHFLHLPNNI